MGKTVGLLTTVLVTVATLVTAQPAYAISSWSNETRVTVIYSGDALLVKFDEMMNPESCTSGGYINVHASGTYHLQSYQTLLTAYLAGKPVRYRVNGCSYYPKLYSVEMLP